MKSGDKVRYIKSGPIGWESSDWAKIEGLKLDEIYTVSEYHEEDKSVHCYVTIKEGEANLRIHPDHFELITDEPKMKLSQIVQAWENGEIIEQQYIDGSWREWAPFYKYVSGVRGFDYSDCALAFYEHRLRIKPRTLSINGVEFPAPEITEPEMGTRYWIPSTSPAYHVMGFKWRGDDSDMYYLNAGYVHLNEESATLHADAILSVTRKKD